MPIFVEEYAESEPRPLGMSPHRPALFDSVRSVKLVQFRYAEGMLPEREFESKLKDASLRSCASSVGSVEDRRFDSS